MSVCNGENLHFLWLDTFFAFPYLLYNYLRLFLRLLLMFGTPESSAEGHREFIKADSGVLVWCQMCRSRRVLRIPSSELCRPSCFAEAHRAS